MELKRYDHIPEGLLDISLEKLDEVLSGPTLIYLKGKEESTLFVSTLLHGNETTGFYAMQRLLKEYQNSGEALPHSLLLFIGNVPAAVQAVRRLPHQQDYNRIWSVDGETEEHQLAKKVLDIVTTYPLLAAIDIHNNSGRNPFYACVNYLKHPHIHLATLFSSTIVYFLTPVGALSTAMGSHCPAVTIECGISSDKSGIGKVYDYVQQCLQIKQFSTEPVNPSFYTLYHMVADIKVPKTYTFGFGRDNHQHDFAFIEGIDTLNFKEVEAGTTIGWYRDEAAKLSVCDEKKTEKGDEYFTYEKGKIRLKKDLVPSMLTLDNQIIRQDCLGYIMEPFALS